MGRVGDGIGSGMGIIEAVSPRQAFVSHGSSRWGSTRRALPGQGDAAIVKFKVWVRYDYIGWDIL